MIKKFLIKSLAMLNACEGVIHLITAGISFYGMYDIGVWDWRVMTAPTFDLFLGCISLLTGYVLHSLDLKHSCLGGNHEKLPPVENGPVVLPFKQ